MFQITGLLYGICAICFGWSNHISPKLEAGRVKYCPRTIVAGIAYFGVPLVTDPYLINF